MKEISVFWEGHEKTRVGRLIESKKELLYFEWDKNFLLNQIELSPINFRKRADLVECPREPFDGLPGFIADSIPDGWGRRLLKNALQRSGLPLNEISYLDMLSFLGKESIGALSFEPELKSNKAGKRSIDLIEIEKNISKASEGTASSIIQALLEAGSSPNGMRPKITLKQVDEKWVSETADAKGISWLIKFRADEDPPYIAELEFAYSLMAQKAGIEISETKIFESGGKSFFGTKRFDREGTRKIHVHTLSGILHTPVTNFSVGYEHFAKAAQILTKDIKEIEKTLRLAAFNVMTSNQDDHIKNISFLMNEKGAWRVAPAYDLTFHRTKFNQHKMHILNNGNPGLNELTKLFNQFGLSSKRSLSILKEVRDAANDFPTIAAELDIPKKEITKIFHYFRLRS